MGNKEKILKIIKIKNKVKASELVKELAISRQKVTKHLGRLVKEGILSKEGSTKNAIYFLSKGAKSARPETKIKLIKKLKGLKEDVVYDEVNLRLMLNRTLNENTQNTVFYAFGEMLNNAIDHSKAKHVEIEIGTDIESLSFIVKDPGIGIFANVMKKFKLENEYQALEHVLKGKQTTFPEQHSGQGIFFTSRIADLFKIRSHKIELTKDNTKDDLSVKEIKNIKGTEVFFKIKNKSKKKLENLFREYSNDDYEFDKTQVKVNLTAEKELLARSQAKRILFGLEKYKIIILDFKKVKEIGQAFVDEVFRVYKNRHPGIQINYINANPAVEFMIQRGLKN